MTNTTHQMISDRAYALWESEGRPAARDGSHWLRAEREILDTLAKPMAEAKPKAKRAPRKKAAPRRAKKAVAA